MHMNKILIIGGIFFAPLFSSAQTPRVEKSIFNIQAGFLGAWINNESRVWDATALRSEIGFDGGFFAGAFYEKTGYVLTPVFTLEPRWYYNLPKRNAASKNIKKNSGNFWGLKTSFNPNWFTISNYEDVKIVTQISLIPKWGIRRMIGSHFNFETGFGIGTRYYFANAAGLGNNVSEIVADLHLRIGLTF